MNNLPSELLDKIRRQFDSSPYPRTPLETSPKNNHNLLYIHNLITPFYLRNQKVIDTQDKLILDAGCGTGYKSLVLAEANPGAKIVGIDISPESIDLAQKRLEYHGFNNGEFYVLPIEELPKLNYQFDYINCDETLYILPEPVTALQAMQSVLKPEGIIRANLHSAMHRDVYLRSQKLFKFMGLLHENPGDLEIDIVSEIMRSLKDNVYLKSQTWNKQNYEGGDKQERILMNFLLQGDKGYTVNELFSFLELTQLEFISMVNWRNWNLLSLFKDPDNLPAFLGMSLPEISVEQQLQIFELLHPLHRLLDFWCGNPQLEQNIIPVCEWEESDWLKAKAYIHPQLNNSQFRQNLENCIRGNKILDLTNHLSLLDQYEPNLEIDNSIAVCFIPLLEQPQPIISLVKYWQQVRPIDPFTLKPIELEQAFQVVQKILSRLESLGYILLETEVGK
jgi:SAM-dependent methyltransferase